MCQALTAGTVVVCKLTQVMEKLFGKAKKATDAHIEWLHGLDEWSWLPWQMQIPQQPVIVSIDTVVYGDDVRPESHMT